MNLASLKDWWQRALGLTQWRIAAAFDGSIYPPNLGVCMPMHEYWQADIRLATPEQAAEVGADTEESLVHEMLHCVFAPFETKAGTPERKEEERAVETLARSFVRMKRAGNLAEVAFRRGVERVIREGARARTARQAATIFAASGRRRAQAMDPKLVALLMKAGELGAGEGLPPEVKALLEELAAAAAGAAPAAGGEMEGAPASEGGMQDPTQAPAMQDPQTQDPMARQARAARQAPGLTPADVQRIFREGEERSRMIAANADRPGMTPALQAWLGDQPLPTVRNFLARLAPKPAEGQGDARAREGAIPARQVPGQGATPPPAAPAAIDPKDTKAIGEAFFLSRLPAIMGANKAHVDNVRARIEAGKPVGVITPERTAEVRALRAPAAR